MSDPGKTDGKKETPKKTVEKSGVGSIAKAVKDIGKSAAKVKEVLESKPGLIRAIPRGAAKASEADVSDEINKGGPALGSFVKSVGLAVAEAQKALDENLVNTAKALSETQIDVIAIFEQQLKDDDGTMDKGVIHMQKLPLINYLMPTAYNWSRVYLEADMEVSEFNAANGLNVKKKASALGIGVSGGANSAIAKIGGSFSYGRSSSSLSASASSSEDKAAGSLHMEATLEPRNDIELPQPFILQKGPRLKLIIGSKFNLDKDGAPTDDPAAVAGRKVEMGITLYKSTGEPHTGKPVEVHVSNPTLNFTGSGTTDGNGKFDFDVSRTGAAFDPETQVEAVVRANFGLVTGETVVIL